MSPPPSERATPLFCIFSYIYPASNKLKSPRQIRDVFPRLWVFQQTSNPHLAHSSYIIAQLLKIPMLRPGRKYELSGDAVHFSPGTTRRKCRHRFAWYHHERQLEKAPYTENSSNVFRRLRRRKQTYLILQLAAFFNDFKFFFGGKFLERKRRTRLSHRYGSQFLIRHIVLYYNSTP